MLHQRKKYDDKSFMYIQFDPAITDVKGSTNSICYKGDSVDAHIGIKKC